MLLPLDELSHGATLSSTIRAFHVPEIYAIILANAAFDIFPLRWLAALARTCRLFHSQANDALWGRYATCSNLLRCLPGHLWEDVRREEAGYQRVLSIKKTPGPGDWDRVRLHASKIRTLMITESSDYLDVEILHMLSLYCPIHPLFPNIRQLFWTSKSPEQFPFLALFAGPKLRFLDVDYLEDAKLVSTLQGVSHYCPLIERLALRSGFVGQFPDFCSTITKYLYLRHLDIGKLCVGVDSLIHVSQLPHLRYLECALPTPAVKALVSQSSSQAGFFPSLEELQVFVPQPTLDPLPTLVHLIRSSSFRSLMVETDDVVPHHFIRAICSELGSHACRDRFAKLEICLYNELRRRSIPDPDGFSQDDYDVDLSAIQGLFSVRGLVLFRIDSPYINFDDHALATMAGAWPGLERLELRRCYVPLSHSVASKITLPGLAALLNGCPNLVFCLLTANADTSFTTSEVVATKNRFRQMHLDLRSSNIATDGLPAAIAFLSTFCSATSSIVVSGTDYLQFDPLASEEQRTAWTEEVDRRAKMWKDILRWNPIVSAAREEEATNSQHTM